MKKKDSNKVIYKNKVKTQSQAKTIKLSKSTGVAAGEDLSDKHKLIIDEYYNNGYNKSRAVLEFSPNIKSQSAAVHVFNAIASTTKAKKYIQSVQARLRSQNHIQREQILSEFSQWAFVDTTQLVGLTPEQVKELPANVRRSIQSYKETERTETDRKGQEITIKTIDLKLVNKLDALKEAGKIIGAYEIDNNQKRGITDLSDTSQEAQNALYKALTLIERDKQAKRK